MTAATRLPPKRHLPWRLKPLDSAKTRLSHDSLGRLVMEIDHAPIMGLTPEHVAWWFANIDGAVTVEGQVLSRYLAWHPIDHIHWSLAKPAPDGGAAEGAKFRIVEAFGGNPAMTIDVVEDVIRLNATGITLRNRLAGLEISRLSHDFTPIPEGTQYRSRLVVGVALPLISKPVNAFVQWRTFTEDMGKAWLKHNVEEVGLLEQLVPLIHPDFAKPVSQ